MRESEETRRQRCGRCSRSDNHLGLAICPICQLRICHRCWIRRHGKVFCGDRCAGYFFFGDGDEIESDD